MSSLLSVDITDKINLVRSDEQFAVDEDFVHVKSMADSNLKRKAAIQAGFTLHEDPNENSKVRILIQSTLKSFQPPFSLQPGKVASLICSHKFILKSLL